MKEESGEKNMNVSVYSLFKGKSKYAPCKTKTRNEKH